MSIREDRPAHCWICSEQIRSLAEEVWLFDLFDREEPGPMHEACATEIIAEDPGRWSRTEPTEPTPEIGCGHP